jgi:predicted pyridoxine 5'-phosphate oxidase superfamily flavin-nucleotide-binding protein
MLRPDLRRWLPAAALLLACSTDDDRDRGTATSITGITSASTASATSPTTGAGETADPESTGLGDATGGGTTDAGTTGTTGPGETGVGTTDFDPPPAGEYAANFIAGDPNHLSVRKANIEGDWCTTITFVSPQDMGPLEYDVTLPATWRVQSALIHQGAADCLSFSGFPGEPTMAVSGTGTASWAGACPTTLDIDLTIAFPLEQPWIPPGVLMQSGSVAVAGC